jgi:hypothetical protein
MTQIRSRPGTWRRHLCKWFGHRNVGIRDHITGEWGYACLRCWGTAYVARPAPIDPKGTR